MRKGEISRTAIPKVAIRIEYEDENYTYMSSEYQHKVLKKDIEDIKVPITITWN
jgi:hypothetical protein